MRDFPAAHSMDSCWYAVDENGEVAYFDTGEGGALPEGFAAGGEAGDDDLNARDVLAALLLWRAQSDERLRALIPDQRTAERLAEHLAGQAEQLLPALGMWAYRCDDSSALPYKRVGRVSAPARLADLPAELRTRLAGGKLPVRFAEMPALAPGTYAPVATWGSHWVDLDGKVHESTHGDSSANEAADLTAAVADVGSWAAEDEPAALGGEELYREIERLLAETGTAPAPGFVGWLLGLLGVTITRR